MSETTIQRRRSPRYAFQTIQRIAPVTPDRKPESRDFVPVRCHDISRGGFSFYYDEKPAFRQLVALVTAGQKCLYLTAEVVHIQKVAGPNGDQYLVGCRFTGRRGG